MNRQIDIYMHFIKLPGNPPLVRAVSQREREELPVEGVEGTEGEGGPCTSAGGGDCGYSINDHLVVVGKTRPHPHRTFPLLFLYEVESEVKYIYLTLTWESVTLCLLRGFTCAFLNRIWPQVPLICGP